MPVDLRDLAVLVAVGLIAYGAALIYKPAGLIAVGLALLVIGLGGDDSKPGGD